MPRKTGDDLNLKGSPLSTEYLDWLQEEANREHKDWIERNSRKRNLLIRGKDNRPIEEERKRKVGIFG